MDDKIRGQLLDLARAFAKVGLRPLICGGLGVYLSLCERQREVPLRVTNDVDLMLTRQQLAEEANRRVIAEIITGILDYRVCDQGKHFQFEKADGQHLDILTQPVDGIPVDGFRAKIVKSRLHAYVTNEADFIDEDKRTVYLSENEDGQGLAVDVPSPTNLLILKLCAFDDRDSGPRHDDDRARDHAFDVYVIVMLGTREDYQEGRTFLARHSDSDVIKRVREIVKGKFSSVDGGGWRRVLESSSFYPHLNVQQKKEKLLAAKKRLERWFS